MAELCLGGRGRPTSPHLDVDEAVCADHEVPKSVETNAHKSHEHTRVVQVSVHRPTESTRESGTQLRRPVAKGCVREVYFPKVAKGRWIC